MQRQSSKRVSAPGSLGPARVLPFTPRPESAPALQKEHEGRHRLPPPGSERKGPTRTGGRSETRTGSGGLAELLSAAMNHPEMPADLYNVIGDWINDEFHRGLNIAEPWVIERAL